MGICPLCNGLTELSLVCPNCSHFMQDQGRLADFFDDYSPYMPIDLMKLEDGFPDNFRKTGSVRIYSFVTAADMNKCILSRSKGSR